MDRQRVTVRNAKAQNIPVRQSQNILVGTAVFSQEDAVELLAASGIVQPMADDSGKLYIDDSGKIFVI